jgi:hypothetical protein
MARLAREVEKGAGDEATRAAARKVAERFTIDRVVVAIMVGCAVMFGVVIAVWH